jgi:hypothetical protein
MTMSAENNRFLSYFVDYVIGKHPIILKYRKKMGLPENGFLLNKKNFKNGINFYNKNTERFIVTELIDYVFIFNFISKQLLGMYMNFGTESMFSLFSQLNKEEQGMGHYFIKHNSNRAWSDMTKGEREIESLFYPISIKVSVGATKSSFKRFIDQHWKTIENLIASEEIKVSKYLKIKSRSYESNYCKLLIFENMHKSTKEIENILHKKFPRKVIYKEQIRTIISNIKKSTKK